ncbi:MAG: hypothetical protein R3E65_08145 [Steroidobacteraceae bacterium]
MRVPNIRIRAALATLAALSCMSVAAAAPPPVRTATVDLAKTTLFYRHAGQVVRCCSCMHC